MPTNVTNPDQGREIVSKETTAEQKVEDMKTGHLQKIADRLDKMMRNYDGIKLRYQEIGKILEEVYDKFADEGVFSKDKPIRFTDGPEKGQEGWDLGNFPEIQRMVKTSHERLTLALEEIRAIEKMEKEISEEEAKMEVEEFVDMRKRIDIEFRDLIKILNKFDKIWKRIKALERRKGIIDEIEKIGGRFVQEIKDENVSVVYYARNKRKISKILVKLERLKRINKRLSAYLNNEFKFEKEDYELLKQLLKGLKYDEDLFQQVKKEYEGFDIHSDIMPKNQYFQSNLNQAEQSIIIHEVTPLIARLYQLTYELIQLIENENQKIAVFEKGVEEILKVQKGRKKISDEHTRLAYSFLNTVKEIHALIEGKEKVLAERISRLENKIDEGVSKLVELERKRGAIVEVINKESKKVPKNVSISPKKIT